MTQPSVHHRVLLHKGRVLWPEHKPLDEVQRLQAVTPTNTWFSTYQGQPTAPGGTTFLREWWIGKNRYDYDDVVVRTHTVARWISWDTGNKDNEDNAFSAFVVGELLRDYTILIRQVWRDHLIFPNLSDAIEKVAQKYNADQKLRGVIIEDKASGTSALQTLRLTASDAIRPLLLPFLPTTDKVTRAEQASVWCRNGCVLLPKPYDSLEWLWDFEDELFNFPGSEYMDQVDSFSQLILYLENYLAQGYQLRS